MRIYSQGAGWGSLDGKLPRGNYKEGSEGVWVNPPNRIFAGERPGWLDKEPDQILKVKGSGKLT